MAFESNAVGPYRVLRRLRTGTGPLRGQVARLYAAVRTASGRKALLLTPASPVHYRPAAEFRLRVRACAAPAPYLALEVEQSPSSAGGTPPLAQLAEGLDALTCALEALEGHPEAAAHLLAPAQPPATSRARTGLWAALGAACVVACLCLPRMRTPEPAEPPGAQPVAVGEEALSEPELLPVASLDAQQPAPGGVGLDMPRKPFQGQRTAPCEEGAEVEVKLSGGARACFIGVKFSAQKCKTKGYEWEGDCYLPSIPAPRTPTSTVPSVPPQVPAQRAR